MHPFGAVSQVTYRGQELIHATVGAALQYHVRYSDTGSMTGDDATGWRFLIDECRNPTQAGSARVFFNIDRTFGLALLSFNNKADGGKIARDTEPRPLFLAYPHQPSIYSRSVRSCGKSDCPNPFTARTIQADFQFTRPGAMVSAHSYLVLGSPDEIERAITAIVAYARSAASPLVTAP